MNDGITCVEKVRTTLLELHAIENKSEASRVSNRYTEVREFKCLLNGQRITVLGNKGFTFASSSEFGGLVEVTFGDGSVLEWCRGEQSIGISVLLDKALRDNPKDFSPDFTNSVDTPIAWFIQGLISRWVNRFILVYEGQQQWYRRHRKVYTKE